MEMVTRGCAAAEATIPSPPQKTTSAKFSGLDSSNPSQQCSANQGSLRNQLSDEGLEMNMAFRLADSCCSARSPPKSRSGTAQLTIFYAGTVNVYDVPADKAKAIMALASSGNNIGNPEMRRDCVKFGHQHASPGTPVGSTWTEIAKQLSSADTFAASYKQRQSIYCDELPLSRKLSLQRFLEKRKERIISKSALKHNPHLSLSSSAENKINK